uniref:Tetraheme cytochrome c subunit of nitrate or TMAO reductase n=1 Tax=Candidatus Kentrum sp. LFY TaxID=2126342 RepID=A0A450U5I2_9GAMM|nr:MAG: Tetraheme cytochrome c subunit of nitrate or TMAO reductase [Candidatus Kentron sp. LFY]
MKLCQRFVKVDLFRKISGKQTNRSRRRGGEDILFISRSASRLDRALQGVNLALPISGSCVVGSRRSFARLCAHKTGIPWLILATVIGTVLGGCSFDAMLTGKTADAEAYCISCHELRDTVYQEYLGTIHHFNRTGVRATCPDCHIPRPLFPKLARKVRAVNDLYQHVAGTIDTPEKFEARRLLLARRVWKTMKETDSRECRGCHDSESMDYLKQAKISRNKHISGLKRGKTCIDCHKGIAHALPDGGEYEP